MEQVLRRVSGQKVVQLRLLNSARQQESRGPDLKCCKIAAQRGQVIAAQAKHNTDFRKKIAKCADLNLQFSVTQDPAAFQKNCRGVRSGSVQETHTEKFAPLVGRVPSQSVRAVCSMTLTAAGMSPSTALNAEMMLTWQDGNGHVMKA
jgi:hypothetical protein